MTATWQSFVGRNTNITSTDVLHNDLILLQGKVVHILTVEELFEEDGPDLFRKGQLFQDSGLLPGVFDDDNLDGRFLGGHQP